MTKLNQKYIYRIATLLLSIIGGVFTLFNFPTPANADTTPEIDYAPSSIQNGQSVTINGSGFGAKPTATPALFDKVENTWPQLQNGDRIPWYTSPWTGENMSTYNTASGDQRSTRSTANYHAVNDVHNYVDLFTAPGRTGKLYVAWWFKSDLTDTGAKFTRFTDSSVYLENIQFVWANHGSYLYHTANPSQCYCVGCSAGGTYWHDTMLPANTWHFHEVYLDTGTGKTWRVMADNVSYGSTTYSSCDEVIVDTVWKVGLDAGGGFPSFPNFFPGRHLCRQFLAACGYRQRFNLCGQ